MGWRDRDLVLGGVVVLVLIDFAHSSPTVYNQNLKTNFCFVVGATLGIPEDGVMEDRSTIRWRQKMQVQRRSAQSLHRRSMRARRRGAK